MEKVTNEELARMVARGFAQTASKDDVKRLEERMDGFDQKMDKFEGRMDHMDDRLEHIDDRLDHMDARLGRIEADIEEMSGNIVYRDEFADLAARVKYLETKIGVVSGV